MFEVRGNMFGPMMLNILAISRWVVLVIGSPQGYYRSRYPYSGTNANKEGTYETFGELGIVDGYLGRSYGRGDACPYDNEKTFRKKREAPLLGISENETTGKNAFMKVFLQRSKRHEAYYRDSGYNNGFRYDRYYDDRRYGSGVRYYNDVRYRDRYDDRYRDRNDYGRNYRRDYGRGRSYGRDRCGKEICTWEAQLECDLPGLGGYRGHRVLWEREHDAYYPRDKYRDLQDYFGSRMRSTDDEKLIITKVKPEDKGVYRCYAVGGDEADFMEVHFFPKYPADANDVDC